VASILSPNSATAIQIKSCKCSFQTPYTLPRI
jgi:hypothetical protein